jgi:hypothetical protein
MKLIILLPFLVHTPAFGAGTSLTSTQEMDDRLKSVPIGTAGRRTFELAQLWNAHSPDDVKAYIKIHTDSFSDNNTSHQEIAKILGAKDFEDACKNMGSESCFVNHFFLLNRTSDESRIAFRNKCNALTLKAKEVFKPADGSGYRPVNEFLMCNTYFNDLPIPLAFNISLIPDDPKVLWALRTNPVFCIIELSSGIRSDQCIQNYRIVNEGFNRLGMSQMISDDDIRTLAKNIKDTEIDGMLEVIVKDPSQPLAIKNEIISTIAKLCTYVNKQSDGDSRDLFQVWYMGQHHPYIHTSRVGLYKVVHCGTLPHHSWSDLIVNLIMHFMGKWPN